MLTRMIVYEAVSFRAKNDEGEIVLVFVFFFVASWIFLLFVSSLDNRRARASASELAFEIPSQGCRLMTTKMSSESTAFPNSTLLGSLKQLTP